jgi:hypothetical protein
MSQSPSLSRHFVPYPCVPEPVRDLRYSGRTRLKRSAAATCWTATPRDIADRNHDRATAVLHVRSVSSGVVPIAGATEDQ